MSLVAIGVNVEEYGEILGVAEGRRTKRAVAAFSGISQMTWGLSGEALYLGQVSRGFRSPWGVLFQ